MDLQPYTKEYETYLIRLASDNIAKGVIEEPRAYFDEIQVPDQTGIIVRSAPEVFRNGERFPVRITHLTAAVQYLNAENTEADERNIQRIGMALMFHDQWYMSERYTACPLWANEVVAAAPAVSRCTAAWRFLRPFVLSSRDSLNVAVQLIQQQESGVPVTVSFTGVGVKSKRPYFFTGDTALTNTQLTPIPANLYRNDGAEPVLITDMTINVAAELEAEDPIGNIRNLRVQVSQLGNGTNASWFIGPVTAPILQGISAVNLGIYSGRAVVHTFPGDGLLWEPGEGIEVFVQRLTPALASENVKLSVALAGYIAVQ